VPSTPPRTPNTGKTVLDAVMPGKMRGAARAGDDYFDAALFSGGSGIVKEKIWRAVCRIPPAFHVQRRALARCLRRVPEFPNRRKSPVIIPTSGVFPNVECFAILAFTKEANILRCFQRAATCVRCFQ